MPFLSVFPIKDWMLILYPKVQLRSPWDLPGPWPGSHEAQELLKRSLQRHLTPRGQSLDGVRLIFAFRRLSRHKMLMFDG
jgi:hypothetical protein